jgi:DNA-binding NarL/FixJ family response regulator
MRVVIADDAALIREGIARLLTDAGVEVVGKAENADRLLELVERRRPDVAIVDIKMPPTETDEGLVAAARIRESHAHTAVLVLSQYLESSYAVRLLEQRTRGTGYLLKERVADVVVLTDAIQRVAAGECVLDPAIVTRLLQSRGGPLEELSDREREVLSLMAEGHSNTAISRRLFVTPKTVEAHVRHIFRKLRIEETSEYHRRVLAVLTYLRAQS